MPAYHNACMLVISKKQVVCNQISVPLCSLLLFLLGIEIERSEGRTVRSTESTC